jgi:hypothetical protein
MYINENNKIRIELEEYFPNKKPLLLESSDLRLEDAALVKFTYKTRESGKWIKYFLNVVTGFETQKNENEGTVIPEQDEHLEASIEEDAGEQGNVIENAYNSRFEKNKLGLTTDVSEHSFRIYKIGEEAKQLCLFVLSSQEILSKFTRLIGEYMTLDELLEQLNVFLLNNVINVLKNLIGFIYECDYNKIAESGSIYYVIQTILIRRDRGFLISLA